MKKIQLLLTFFAAILLGLTACQHNIDAPVPQQFADAGQKHAFDPKFVPNDDIEAKLRAFNEYLNSFQNAKSRDAQAMSAEQVKWNVEALLNATYSQADKVFTRQSINRDSFLIPLSNGAVSSENVVNAWRGAKSLLHDQYVSVRETGKHVVFVDIDTKIVNSNQLQLKISSVIGINEAQSRTDPYSWDDNWWWGFGAGKCPQTPVSGSKDAAVRLNEELNTRYIFIINPHVAQDMYFTDIDFFTIQPQSFRTPNDPLDNIRDYATFYVTPDLGVNFFGCISWEDMNWYYNSLFNLVTNAPFPISLVKGSNKSFLYSAIYGESTTDPDPPLFHTGNIYYGIAHPIFRTCCSPPEP